MRKIYPLLGLLLVLGLGAFTWWRAVNTREVTREEFVMGTFIDATAYGRNASAALDKVYQRLREIEQKMTLNQSGSEIAAVNAGAGQAPVKVSRDTLLVVQKALEYARLSSGKFDPTVQPIVALWHIGYADARVPNAAEITAKLPLVNYQAIQLDAEQLTIYLPVAGMGLDLGGIAKGYAADEAVAILRDMGVHNALLSLGGNVYALGQNPTGKPWRIGIQNPEDERNTYVAVIEATDETLVSSGGYERYLEVDGKRYHHIIDPDTGYPAVTDVLSSTIITTQSIDADALSTSVFALGREKGLELIEQLPGVEAVVIDNQHLIYVSSGMKSRVTVTDELYQLVP